MASFTEQATLRVVDQSSAQIKKINAELKKLFATAKSLKSASSAINIRVNTNQLNAATQRVQALNRALSTLQRHRINLSINQSGLTSATAALNRLRAQAARPITITTRHTQTGGTGGPGGTGAPPRSSTPGSRRRYGTATPGGAVVYGAAAGLGISNFSRLNAEFGVLAFAAAGAAKALKEIGEAGYARSRTEGQTQAMMSPAQQAVLKKIDETNPGWKNAPIPFREDYYKRFRNEIAGDVAARGDPEQTARNADIMTRHLQNELYPGLVLRNPQLTLEQAGEGQKKIVKAAGMATSEIFKDGKLTADYLRFESGIQAALRVNPDIDFEKVRTTVAGMRTAGYQLTPEAIARGIVQAGDKGARVGNELFQFQQSMRGVFKNKALNKALAARGVQMPGGKIRDESLLGKDPAQWAYNEFNKDVEKHLKSPETQKRITAAMAGGQTREEAEQNEAVNVLGKLLPSLKQTTLSFLAESILGFEQWQKQLEQSRQAADPAKTAQIATDLASIKWENLKTAVDAAAGNLGKLGLDAVGASGALTGFTKLIRGEELTPQEQGAVIGTGAGAAGLSLLLWRLLRAGAGGPAGMALGIGAGAVAGAGAGAAGLSPATSLNMAAGALSGAAAHLSAAAVVLGGKGILGAGAAAAGGAAATAGGAGAAARGGMGALKGLAAISGWGLAAWGLYELLTPPEIKVEVEGKVMTALEKAIHDAGRDASPEVHPAAQAAKSTADELAKLEGQIKTWQEYKASPAFTQKGRDQLDQKIAGAQAKMAELYARLEVEYEALKNARTKYDETHNPDGTPKAKPGPKWPDGTPAEKIPPKPWPGEGGAPAAEPIWLPGFTTTLGDFNTTFAGAFTTGAAEIQTAGASIGASMIGAAPQAGSIIAGAITTAVSNVKVTVDVNQSKAPVGEAKP